MKDLENAGRFCLKKYRILNDIVLDFYIDDSTY